MITAVHTGGASASRNSLALDKDKPAQPTALRPAGRLFSPEESLIWICGSLAVAACVAPWFAHGWLWFTVIAAIGALLTGFDALALWRSRQEGAPKLLLPTKGLRGREGQTIPVPLAH